MKTEKLTDRPEPATGGVVELPGPIWLEHVHDGIKPTPMFARREGKSAAAMVIAQNLARLNRVAEENKMLREQVRSLRIGWAITCGLLGFLLWWTMGGAR